jgi:uncharacterized phage protein (TIGR01671 family)
MRDKKFRIHLNGTFHYWGFIKHHERLVFAGIPQDNHDIITMEEAMERSQQFTGLLDKNGKEIWEGDIVKECTVGSVIWDGEGVIEECPTGVVKITPTLTTLDNDKVGKVRLKNGSYSYLFLSKYDGTYEWPDNIEVIGNIYENPELING